MPKPAARVVTLPTAADIAEEAERMGVPTARLQEWAGALGFEGVKLEGVPQQVASALQGMIAPPAGLVVISQARQPNEERGPESHVLRPAEVPPPAQESGLSTPHPPALTPTLSQGERESWDTTLSQGERESWDATPSPEERENTQDSALRTQDSSQDSALRTQDSPQDSGLSTQDSSQDSGLRTQDRTWPFTVLIAGSRPLLLDAAARLESGGGAGKETAGELRGLLERFDGGRLGTTRCGGLTFEWGRRSYVMGIINVTPDSFSGDGLGRNLDAALAQAERFVQAGVDILDVGGESTRPGHEEVSIQEERDRVIPVVKRLVQEMPVPVSIDSYRLLVVQEALEAGARMVNDVWGLRRTEGLGSLAAAYGVPIVLMHNRRADATRTRLGGHFQQVQYHDLMGEIIQGLRESVDLALRSNVPWENIIVDPGIGFGKTPPQNLVVMRRLRELKSLGRPILMGTSRKSVIGITLGVPMEDRVEGTAATVAMSIGHGADIVRVHDVKEMVRISRMTDAIVRA